MRIDYEKERKLFTWTPKISSFYRVYNSQRKSVTGKFRFLVICQLVLLWFLAVEAFTSDDTVEAFKTPPDSFAIVMARFLCATFLHISLVDEVKQGLNMMKFSINHSWMFRKWNLAFFVGFCQLAVVESVEIVNLAILNTNNTIMEILMNFLALVIIVDFDNYFFQTV